MEGYKNNKKIVQELKEVLIARYKEDSQKETGVFDKYITNEAVLRKTQELKKKYPDFDDYELYHVLIGSGKGNEVFSKFDFPGEDSVESFIRSL